MSLALALSESALGEHALARQRVQSVIAEQQTLGVRGLLLGRAYEHLARIAIRAGNTTAFEAAALQVAAEYRPRSSSVLGALYQRLIEEARQAGVGVPSQPHAHGGARALELSGQTLRSRVAEELSREDDARSLASKALSLLCEHDPPRSGCLFLLDREGLHAQASIGTAAADNRCGDLLAHAQRLLELEMDDGSYTVDTGELSGTDLLTEAATRDTIIGGTRYLALPLCSADGGKELLVGIAVLSTSGPGDDAPFELARSISQHLIQSGHYAPVAAA